MIHPLITGDTMHILTIENLNVSFKQYEKGLRRREVRVVENLNLEIQENEIFAIFGASGSGKSIFAHAILRLLPYNAKLTGKISYKGREITEDNIASLRGRDIWLIPQTVNALNPLLKIKDQTRINLSKEQYRVQEKIYEEFGLHKDVLEMYPHELSGGMARRVLVADAILSDADLLIADEPTPGMDEEAIDEIIHLFEVKKKEGKTMVLITHDMNMALRCADRIGIFFDGSIIDVFEKTKFLQGEDVLTDSYAKMLIRAMPEEEFKAPTVEEMEHLC